MRLNILLQIALPLLLTAGVLIFLMVKRKYFHAGAAVLCAVLLIASVTLGVIGLKQKGEAPAADAAAVSGNADNSALSLMTANRLLRDGYLDDAQLLLDELQQELPGDSDVLLASARCAVLGNNPSLASVLYRGAGDAAPEEELEYVSDGVTADNGAMITYLKNLGENPADYGLRESAAANTSGWIKTVRSGLRDSIDEAESNDLLAEAADYAAKLIAGFRDAQNGGRPDALFRTVSDLSDLLEQNETLQSCRVLRLALLRGRVLRGDYDGIAGQIGLEATPEELMVVTDLLISGKIRSSDFPESYRTADTEICEAVISQFQETLNSIESLTNAERASYQKTLKALKSQMKDPVMYLLRAQLTTALVNAKDTLVSKLYLEMAKLEMHAGNDSQAEEYLGGALGTASNSDDPGYSVPMNTLMDIINGTTDTETIKDVADYVDEAIDHSLPLDITPVSGGETPEGEAFNDYMTATVSEMTAVINIGTVDVENFPVVKARVQINSNQTADLKELEKLLHVRDCGSAITKFTLDEMTFSRSRIILLCDNSGSMSGSVGELKNAVRSFAADMGPGELVSVMTFDSGIREESDFTADSSEVAGYADWMGDYGGTDMYNALLKAIDRFPDDITSNNIIILMTDGDDNHPASDWTISEELGGRCALHDVTVYTVGLGRGVDTGYLTKLAAAGNGSFLYVDSDEALSRFYSFIHTQLKNQAILTFTAVNRTLNERTLALSLENELGSAEKKYWLVKPDYSAEEHGLDPLQVTDDELEVYGLTAKFLYRSSKKQTVQLRGNGFDSGDEITITLKGAVGYPVEASFVDEKTYSLTIPEGLAVGTYTVEGAIRDMTFTLPDELTVANQGSMKTYTFGSYVFTALNSKTENGTTTLSGNVILNGWLRFCGDVSLYSPSPDSERIQMTAPGAYIEYSKTTALSGLAKTLAQDDLPAKIPKIGTLWLYNQPYSAKDYTSFPVDEVTFSEPFRLSSVVLENPTYRLYPDTLQAQVTEVTLKLPFQKLLLRNLDKSFSFSGGASAMLNATQIGLKAKADLNLNQSSDYEQTVTFVRVPVRLSRATADIDTLRDDYSFGIGFKFKALGPMDSIDLDLAWKEGKFDELKVQTGTDAVTLTAAPVPITMQDFGVELSNLSAWAETGDGFWNKLIHTEVGCLFQVNLGDIAAKLPKIKELLVKDPKKALAPVVLKDCKLSLQLCDFRLAFEADVSLLDQWTVGHAELEAGNFSYSNRLLGIYGADEVGIRAKLAVDVNWHSSNLDLDMGGFIELTLGYPYTGLWGNLKCDFEVGWWVLKKDVNVSGDALIALYKNSSDNLQFSIIVKGQNTKGQLSGFQLHITKGRLKVTPY